MGTSVEFFFQPPGDGAPLQADYLIGEDVFRPGGLRSMAEPRRVWRSRSLFEAVHRDPRTTAACTSTPGSRTMRSTWPIEGGTNRTSGLERAGVGAANREQIEKVFYRAFTQLLPANATFAVARAATIQAARDLVRRQQRRGTRRHAGLDRRGGELMVRDVTPRDWLVGAARRRRTGSGTARGALARRARVVVSVSGGVPVGGGQARRTTSSFARNPETETVDVDYPVQAACSSTSAPAIRVWKHLGVGLAVSRVPPTAPPTSRRAIPHPFFSSSSRGRSSGTEDASCTPRPACTCSCSIWCRRSARVHAGARPAGHPG